MTRLVWMVVLLTSLVVEAAAAQTDPLSEVEALLATGRFTPARTALDQWFEQHPAGAPTVTSDQRAHALFLRGRLTTDAAESEEAYRAVVLSYPSSPFAPQALLLLGQSMAAQGENERAEAHLRRLVTDYPASAQRPTAMLWIARIHADSTDWPDACETVKQAITTRGVDHELLALLRSEEEASCNRPAARFTVQVAAVRSKQNAEALTARLRRLGFDARTTLVESSELLRVRVGYFISTTEAAPATRRLRAAGFEAIVVDDVRRETQR